MTVSLTEGGLGTWMTFPTPRAGQPWTVQVPDSGNAWRVWGGGVQIVTSSTVASRVPGLIASLNGDPFYVHYDVDSTDTTSGPPASTTAWIVYHDHASALPRAFTSLPFPVGLPPVWLPPGTVLQGVMQNMQAGDQYSQLGLLVEVSKVRKNSRGFGAGVRAGF